MAQYDGNNWTIYDDKDLLSNNITGLVFDQDDTLWVAHADGVTRFDGQSWETLTKDNGLAGDMVDDILRTDDGNLWLATSDGGVSLYTYDKQEWHTFNSNNSGLPSDDADVLYEDSESRIWIAFHDKGVARYDGQNWAIYNTDTYKDLLSNQISAIMEDTDGNIWFGTDKGISVYNLIQNSWSKHQKADGLLSDQVLSMYRDRNGWIWIGSPDGLSCYTNQGFHRFTPADGLAGRHIQAIWEDKGGNLWFGTGSGISRLQFKPTKQ